MTTTHGALRKLLTRLGAGIAGALIIYHEVYIADTAEPLLIFLGLWLLGIPPALFLDGLRKITVAVDKATAEIETAVGDATVEPHRRRDDERVPPKESHDAAER